MLKNVVGYTCVFLFLTAPGSTVFAADAAGTTPDVPPNTATRTPKLAPDYPDKQTLVLTMARQANDEVFTQLHSFVCNEEIHRFKGWTDDDAVKSIDTVQTTVSFENGAEHYADIRQNSRVRASLSDVGGAWSEGEFGTLFGQTQRLLHDKTPKFEAFAQLDGIPVAIYVVDVAHEESPWILQVAGHQGPVPFRTRIFVAQNDGQILRIERFSLGLPFESGIGEIRWDITLKEVSLNGRSWLLPTTGNYAVVYKSSHRREWNTMRFSEYRRYASEVAIRFQ